MQIVILAANKPEAKNKEFIPLKDFGNQPFIDIQLEEIRTAGLPKPNLVCGFSKRVLSKKKSYNRIVCQEDYREKGFSHSIFTYLQKTSIDEDTLFLPGNCFLSSKILLKIAACPSSSCVVDEYCPKKISAVCDKNKIYSISYIKEMPRFIGAFKILSREIPLIRNSFSVKSAGNLMPYEHLNNIISAGAVFAPISISKKDELYAVSIEDRRSARSFREYKGIA